MMQYFAVELVRLLNRLSEESDSAFIHADERDAADQGDKQRVLALLNEVERHCEKIELVKIKGRIKPFKSQLESAPPCSYQIMDDELGKLRHVIAEEIRERVFTYISPIKAPFFEQDALFGVRVNQRFPSAKSHIRSAGNCLAADLHTAAVFHLMCVAELGLRALAKRLHVAKVRKTVPLELGTWGGRNRGAGRQSQRVFPQNQKGAGRIRLLQKRIPRIPSFQGLLEEQGDAHPR
jgi:hypothetical protein